MGRLRGGGRSWVRLPGVTKTVFVARSTSGRRIKFFLFGLGALLPAGSLIWALLAWHGSSVVRSARRGREGP